MKTWRIGLSLRTLFTGRRSHEPMKNGMIEGSASYIRIKNKWMTVEEYRRRYVFDKSGDEEQAKPNMKK